MESDRNSCSSLSSLDCKSTSSDIQSNNEQDIISNEENQNNREIQLTNKYINGNNVCVALRCRPPFEHELDKYGCCNSVLEFQENTVSVQVDRNYSKRHFALDYVWPPAISQSEIYGSAVKGIVNQVLDGQDGVILAYGQTGTGKTYTMGFLDVKLDREEAGIIPRVFEQIFSTIEKECHEYKYVVKMSFAQIYLETVQVSLRMCKEYVGSICNLSIILGFTCFTFKILVKSTTSKAKF